MQTTDIIKRANAQTLGDFFQKQGFDATGAESNWSAIIDFVYFLIDVMLALAGMAAVVMFMMAAFAYATSYGNDAKIETAKKTMLYTLVGLLLVAAAYFWVNQWALFLK